MVQLNKAYKQFQEMGAEVLGIHVECSEAGTRSTHEKHNINYPLANDDRLRIVDKYGPTSTYLIDSAGIVRARWLDAVHERVDHGGIIKALSKLGPPSRL